MPTYKLTSLILVLILVPLLSACRTDGIDTPSGALVTPSAESNLEVSEATSIPTKPPVPTDTSIPPTLVAELPVLTDTPVPPTPVVTEPPASTDTPVPPTPVVALPPPTLLYFWAQW
jgi:hypothetical protein